MTKEKRTADYVLTNNKDVDEIIKVLEKEPCEDAVSRKAIFEMIEQIQDAGGFIGYNTYLEAFDRVDNMPPVTPTRKTGKWKNDGHGHILCTACNEVNVNTWKSKYCPSCGAKMER